MPKPITIVFILSVVWVGGLSLAQENADPPIAKLAASFTESFADEVKVSGQLIVGVTLSSAPTSGDRLAVLIPTASAGDTLCVRVLSQDARYSSKNEFTLPAIPQVRFAVLEYPTDYGDLLKTLGTKDLAILAHKGDCSRAVGDEWLIAGRGVSAMPVAVHGLQVLVNSGRRKAYIRAKTTGKWSKPLLCESMTEGRQTGFDTVCRIETAEATQQIQVQVQMYKNNRRQDKATFAIRIGK